MIFPFIFQLSQLGLYDAGVPNKERILLRATEAVNLSQFCMIIAHRTQAQNVVINNNLYWFPDTPVAPPCWIVLKTGEGQDKVERHPVNGQPIHFFYWGRKTTIFNSPEIIPILVQVNSILTC